MLRIYSRVVKKSERGQSGLIALISKTPTSTARGGASLDQESRTSARPELNEIGRQSHDDHSAIFFRCPAKINGVGVGACAGGEGAFLIRPLLYPRRANP